MGGIIKAFEFAGTLSKKGAEANLVVNTAKVVANIDTSTGPIKATANLVGGVYIADNAVEIINGLSRDQKEALTSLMQKTDISLQYTKAYLAKHEISGLSVQRYEGKVLIQADKSVSDKTIVPITLSQPLSRQFNFTQVATELTQSQLNSLKVLRSPTVIAHDLSASFDPAQFKLASSPSNEVVVTTKSVVPMPEKEVPLQSQLEEPAGLVISEWSEKYRSILKEADEDSGPKSKNGILDTGTEVRIAQRLLLTRYKDNLDSEGSKLLQGLTLLESAYTLKSMINLQEVEQYLKTGVYPNTWK